MANDTAKKPDADQAPAEKAPDNQTVQDGANTPPEDSAAKKTITKNLAFDDKVDAGLEPPPAV